jgi:hypothetical protein
VTNNIHAIFFSLWGEQKNTSYKCGYRLYLKRVMRMLTNYLFAQSKFIRLLHKAFLFKARAFTSLEMNGRKACYKAF